MQPRERKEPQRKHLDRNHFKNSLVVSLRSCLPRSSFSGAVRYNRDGRKAKWGEPVGLIPRMLSVKMDALHEQGNEIDDQMTTNSGGDPLY